MTGVAVPPRFDLRLLVGPGLVVVGLALLKLSDVLVTIGPLDRAQFGWAIPVPMLLLAPGAIALAARTSGPRAARRVGVLTGLILAVSVGVAWFLSTTQVGCDPQPALTTKLAASLPIPLVLGIGWTGASWLAIPFAARPIVALVVGAVGAIIAGGAMLATWAVFFPGLTCSAGPLAG